MWYVQAQSDTFIRHIFDAEPTQWDADNYCYARRLTPEQAAHFGAVSACRMPLNVAKEAAP